MTVSVVYSNLSLYMLNNPEFVPDRELAKEVPSLYTDVATHQRLKGKSVNPERIHSTVTTYLEKGLGRLNDFTANILASELLKMPPRPRSVYLIPVDNLTIASPPSFLNRLKKPLQVAAAKFQSVKVFPG